MSPEIRVAPLVAFAVFLVLMTTTIGQLAWYEPYEILTPSTEEIGVLIFTKYILPFEVISLILLAAMIGAIFLARKEASE